MKEPSAGMKAGSMTTSKESPPENQPLNAFVEREPKPRPKTNGHDAERYRHIPTKVLIQMKLAKDTKFTEQKWLWPDFIPLGGLTLIAGAPDTGKSFVAISIAANVTNGSTNELKDTNGIPIEFPTGPVIYWSSEERLEDIAKRATAAGARLEMLHLIENVQDRTGPRRFSPAKDLHLLEDVIVAIKPMLVVIDNIGDVFAQGTDSHNNTQARAGIAPIVDLAHRTGTTFLAISHFTKGNENRSALDRVNGSTAIGAMPRSVLVVAKEQSQQRGSISMAKCNLTRERVIWDFKIVEAPLENARDAARVQWGTKSYGTATEALKASGPAVSKVEEWIREYLDDGPKRSEDMREAAIAAGHTFISFKRAKSNICHSYRSGEIWWVKLK